MSHEPGRQIHLDFHTSEHIPDIGAEYSKEQFQGALKIGKVNLINVFAKCHHSWSYYPTKIGNPHPNLKIDLLGEQIEACHEIGVKAPVYYTVGWSAHDAETHPEWCIRTESGEIHGSWNPAAEKDSPKPPFQWKHLCPSREYHDLIVSQTEEICKTYATDGLWYDIYQSFVPCYCPHCLKGMAKENLNPKDRHDVLQFRALTIQRHCEDLVALIRGIQPDASIYFNGLTALERPENLKYALYRWNTKHDLEDLPTTWGGYDKFPLRSKWFHRENKPIVAMSGKFHTSWGEFGGFKDPEALRYEAATMVAFGARCNIGDQLHPSGLMDMSTYQNIGHAYDYVAKIEEYGIGGKPKASLGFWVGNDAQADEGLVQMLLEEQIDFEVVRPGEDLEHFETLIIPSVAGVLEGYEPSITAFLAREGTMLVLGEGLLNGAKDSAVLEQAGTYEGPGNYDIDYTVIEGSWDSRLPESPFLNYSSALRFAPPKGLEILTTVREPYFSRTHGRYCGHQNTPYGSEAADHPGVIQNGNLIYSPHPLDRMYYVHGALVHRRLFNHLLKRLHKHPMVEVDLPSAGRINLLHLAEQNRYVLHLMYAPPLKRGRCLVIEDMPPLDNVSVRLRLPEKIEAVRLIPEENDLDFQIMTGKNNNDHSAVLTVPRFSCHCALVIDLV